MSTELKNMVVYSTDFYGNTTFRMLPLTKECPYNEVIYDPETKVLAVISKDFKEKPNMFPKLNEKGKPILLKGASLPDSTPEYVQERMLMQTYYEYYLDKVDDIRNFIELFAINNQHDSLKIIDEELKN